MSIIVTSEQAEYFCINYERPFCNNKECPYTDECISYTEKTNKEWEYYEFEEGKTCNNFGNKIILIQLMEWNRLDRAIRKLKEQGLENEEIAKKLYTPLEYVNKYLKEVMKSKEPKKRTKKK